MIFEKKISTQQKLIRFIENQPTGEIFGYSDLSLNNEDIVALSKAFSRLSKTGIIKRLKKGLYYKPKQTVFGELKPGENEIVKILTQNKKSIAGYKTGVSEYNRLGLTTQVPKGIVIKAKGNKRKGKIGNLEIKYKSLSVNMKQNDSDKLQILDALKNIKRIPDTNAGTSITRLISIVQDMSLREKYRLLWLSKKYNAQTRALLGAIFELNGNIELSNIMLKTLNPLTSFKIKIDDKVIPNKSKWRIK